MKRSLITLAIAVFLTAVMALPAFSMPAEEILNLKSMWNTDWSSDGKYITFCSDGEICLLELATGVIRNMTENNDYVCMYPVFSPDGKEIYFSEYKHKYGELPLVPDRIVTTQAITIATGEQRLIVEGAYVAEPSQDGRYLVYTKDWKYRGLFDLMTGEEKIYDISDATEPPYFDIGMSEISPDNTYFITNYLRFKETPTLETMNRKWVSCKVDIATGAIEMLDLGDYSYWYHQFSPDGTKLLVSQIDFEQTDPPVNENTVWYFKDGTPYNVVEYYQSDEANVWIKDPETGEFVHPNMENYWSIRNLEVAIYTKKADGNFYFASCGLGNYSKSDIMCYHVAIYDMAAGEITYFIDSGNFETKMASWSPDGSQICYIMYNAERTHYSLYIYDLIQKTHKLVVNGETSEIIPVAVEEEAAPAPFAIAGNYPNPFNPTTTIEFSLEKAGLVSLDIFNATGQKVRTLQSSTMTPGTHSIVWNGRDDTGKALSSGIYICRLKMGAAVQSKSMLLVK